MDAPARALLAAGLVAGLTVLLAEGRSRPVAARDNAPPTAEQLAERADVRRGRDLVIHHDCNGCHGGGSPALDGWLVGAKDSSTAFKIGPFTTWPRNLTPDNRTGLGRFTERQIFNALRYGLRPGETPDVTITSTVPGEGGFPAMPKYLAIPMPWPAFRHLSDQDLWDIAAYLKRALKPVVNRVPDSEGPPDFWADAYTVDKIGPHPSPAFPTTNEVAP